MRNSISRLISVAILIAVAACAGSAAGGSALVPLRAPSAAVASRPCGLRLPPPARGELAFRIPSGGHAARRLLAGRLTLCTLFRKDGSRFARLYSDSHNRVLGVAFYRSSGVLRSAVDTAYAVAPEEIGASVKCDSSSQASIGPTYWRKPRHWWIGATVKGIDRDAVVKAVRNAQSEWTNNINWCGIKDEANPPASLRGQDVRRCQARRQERHRLGQPGERPGLQRGARLHGDLVRRTGKPGRVRHPFQHRVQVVDDGCLGRVRHPVRRGARDRPRPPVRPRDEPIEARLHRADVAVRRYRRHDRPQARPRRRAPGQQPLLRNVWRDGDRIVQVGQHLDLADR